MSRHKPSDAAVLMLGISKQQIAKMQDRIDKLEVKNQYIGLRRVRQAIDQRLVEIRLLLRDGHIKNLNRSGKPFSEDFTP